MCKAPARRVLACLVALCVVASASALFGRAKQQQEAVAVAQPRDDSLVETVGRMLWASIAKYKWYFTLLLGVKLDEETTVQGMTIVCNVLYCWLILKGFRHLPRNRMLVIACLTAFIGPALVLIVLGVHVALIVLAAFYPGYFCLGLWIFVFMGSSVVQTVGVALGCDVDGDGDVDWLDLLAWLAKTRLGRYFRLERAHRYFSTTKRSLIEEINHRFDQLERDTLKRLEAKIAAVTVSSGRAPSSGSTLDQHKR